ncbi:kinase-like domain-containing protein [Lyophyllum atratum]|nr:kinase-like domain-containing protein [Lyophyllum atratum]
MKAPFDPGDVVTTDRLNAYRDEGRPMLNNYTRHAKIGEGQHGEVYLCYQVNPRYPHGHPDRRVPVAMKSVKRDNPRAKQFRQLRQQRLPTSAHTPLVDRLGTTEAKIRKEIAIMKKCRHPHVVRLYEIIDDRTRDKIYMVMEYLAGGEVKWKNENDQPILSVEQTRRIIRDAALGLEYLHNQGIIHRDIKPANLLWTEDRRQVKIADFGVSHFSYAQRLAAAGKDGSVEDPEDPILLDDSDLTRRAGTPSFLAPEIVYEHTNDPSPGSSSGDVPTTGSSSLTHGVSSQSVPSTHRPPITKSIDIWALGVTLYCLLFGRTPFMADPAAAGTEWSLYNSICNQDWSVDDTMGSDRLPTGGRNPIGEATEGALVVHLLDHLLKKDVEARITLDEVKFILLLPFQRNSWIIRGLAESDKWLQLTMPRDRINVSVDETSDAMSTVHFRWNWGVVSRRISSLFRRSREPNGDDLGARGPVKSDPHHRIRRYQSARLEDAYPLNSRREKGKQRSDVHAFQGPGSKSLRSKSIERWPVSARRDAASRSTPTIPDPSQARRGSVTLLVPERSKFNSVSSQSSPIDKPKARFANIFNFSNITHWRPNKFSPAGPSPTDTPGSTVTQPSRRTTTPAPHSSRRSEEALRYHRPKPQDPSAPLTADRRASSWGQGDNPVEFAEAISMTSSFSLAERDPNVALSGPYNDRAFVRTPSRLSTSVATASPSSGPNSREDDEGEERQFGPACFDEDSSTIASAEGAWQNGSDDEEDDGIEVLHDGVVFEEDDDDDDSDDVEENPVTFSPRRRPRPIE